MLLPHDILRITAGSVYIWGGGGIYLQHRSFFTRPVPRAFHLGSRIREYLPFHAPCAADVLTSRLQ